MIGKSLASRDDFLRKRRKNDCVPSQRADGIKNRLEQNAASTPNGRTALSDLKQRPDGGLSAPPLPAIIHGTDASPTPALSPASPRVSWS